MCGYFALKNTSKASITAGESLHRLTWDESSSWFANFPDPGRKPSIPNRSATCFGISDLLSGAQRQHGEGDCGVSIVKG